LYKFIKDKLRRILNFDISPIDHGGLSKFFMFIIWGLNAIIFIGEYNCEEQKHCSANYDNCIVCTVTKKITKAELYIENTFLIDSREFIIISSYDFEIPQHDVIIKPTGRAPPQFS
jgi:hypothetical protein